MADQQVGSPSGIANANIGDADNKTNLNGGNGDPRAGFDDDDMDTVAAMRTRLAAIDGTFYTTARLNTLSYNDMVYALRVEDNPDSIKQ